VSNKQQALGTLYFTVLHPDCNMNENPNKIQRLQLENFTCFERADLEFSPGINVFIGENGTGKTHLLKVMYYTVASKARTNNAISEYFGIKLTAGGVKKLIKQDFKRANIKVIYEDEYFISYQIQSEETPIGIIGLTTALEGLFVPASEMLSWQKGFQSLYEKREVSFDRTYYDLAVSLGLGILKNSALEEAKKLAKEIREAIKAEVIQRDERFYFKFDDLDAEIEAPIVAQGINKLGQLYYLILNGSLTKDTILFWDEPETGLNPKYIKVVAQFLQTLAKAGVQIFVATHDYLLTHHLSLAAEYREQTQAPGMKFFALYKGENGTEIETGATLAEIENDSILEEYAALHDVQLQLYQAQFEKVQA
jgi:predicted ATPase